MEKAVISVILLGVISGLTSGAGVLPDGSLNAAVGRTVMFTVAPVEGMIYFTEWKFKGEQIFVLEDGTNKPSPGYEDRISFFPSTGSLELRNVSLSDSGEYRVILTAESGSHPGSVALKVYVYPTVPVSKVAVSVSGTDLLESDSVHFSCSASTGSPPLNFLWTNSSSEVTASDRVQITATDEVSNLTITNVGRYDQGTYKCTVSNPVNSGTSAGVDLIVSYGPENVQIYVSQTVGEGINMYCSADSRPKAQFRWFVNDTELPSTGSEFRPTEQQLNDGGTYSCMAINNNTSKSKRSMYVTLTGIERLSNHSVTSSTDHPTEGKVVNLTCNAAGSVYTRRWRKDRGGLAFSHNILFYDNDRVLSFQPLEETSGGNYSCEISNPINSVTAEYELVVNYIPDPPDLGLAIAVIICLVVFGAASAFGCLVYKKKVIKPQPRATAELQEVKQEHF